jgi:hypothetical protein
MQEQLEKIADALESDIYTKSESTVSFDVDTYNMLCYSLGEISEQLKRIADNMEKK